MASSVVLASHNVLLRVPNGEIKAVTLMPGSTISLGRYGNFLADELIGKTYGKRFEIKDKLLMEVQPLTVEEVEDTDATNEFINDDRVHPLSTQEIEALKTAGVHASEIIQKQIEQHAAYQLKNEYSKDKYKKRKEAKFSKNFTVIEPTLHNVAEYWFTKDQNRIRDLRSDTLSQMLHLANVQPGGRYLAVDDVSGLLVAAILDRLHGQGRLLTIGDVDGTPAYPVAAQLNLPPDMITSVHVNLNWATADEEYTPMMLQETPQEGANERHQARLNKRKATAEALNAVREELFSGEYDGLLIASQYNPWSVMERLHDYLAGSGSIVIYSPNIQTISDLQSTLRDDPRYLGPTVTEAWLRQYQVLPGRTHPMMTTSGSGGYLLHAMKVYDDPNASAATIQHSRKKAKITSGLDTAAIVACIPDLDRSDTVA